MRVDTGKDWQATALGGGVNADAGFTGTSTAVATATLTMAAAGWTVDQWKGHMVATGSVYGVVASNTATVLTVEKWMTPNDPGGTAAANPATGVFVILPGQAPAWWIGLSSTNAASVAGDTVMAGELFAAGGGLNRKRATWAHTTGAASYTLTVTHTSVVADGAAVTVYRMGAFPNAVTSGAPSASTSGRMAFETLLDNPATLVPSAGDVITTTQTVSI